MASLTSGNPTLEKVLMLKNRNTILSLSISTWCGQAMKLNWSYYLADSYMILSVALPIWVCCLGFFCHRERLQFTHAAWTVTWSKQAYSMVTKGYCKLQSQWPVEWSENIVLRVVSIFILNCITKVSETTTESDRELTKDLEMRLAETAPRIFLPKVLVTQSFCSSRLFI